MYAYAANNPVRYIDPDGRIYKNNFERIFVQQVLGDKGVFFYDNATFIPCAPKDSGLSLPLDIIFYDKATYDNPILNDKNTFIHELFHQMQYNSEKGMFGKLYDEFLLDEQMAHFGSITYSRTYCHPDGTTYIKNFYDGKTVSCYVYQYESFNLSKYKTLSDLPFYESQAQFVGDYAELYFDARFGRRPERYKETRLRQMAEIMKNSGFENTEAVKWVLENIK